MPVRGRCVLAQSAGMGAGSCTVVLALCGYEIGDAAHTREVHVHRWNVGVDITIQRRLCGCHRAFTPHRERAGSGGTGRRDGGGRGGTGLGVVHKVEGRFLELCPPCRTNTLTVTLDPSS